MPTERFDKLNEQKKKRIGDAIIGEIRQHSCKNMEISRIAQKAGVSRGSLYTYFQDKDDMILCVMCRTWREALERDKENLQSCGGDLWAMQELALNYRLEVCRANPLFRQIYLAGKNSDNAYEADFCSVREREYEEYKEWIYEHMDKGPLKRRERADIHRLLGICGALLMASVLECMCGAREEPEILLRFKEQLSHLKSELEERGNGAGAMSWNDIAPIWREEPPASGETARRGWKRI